MMCEYLYDIIVMVSVYSIVFGGFSAESLQSRILDGKLLPTMQSIGLHDEWFVLIHVDRVPLTGKAGWGVHLFISPIESTWVY